MNIEKINKQKIIIISSPSGAGKTTICNKIIKKNKKINLSISYTTRPIRKREKDGIDYYFIDKKKFNVLKNKKIFIETAKVFDNFYGSPYSNVINTFKKNKHILFDIDWQGASKLRRKFSKDDTDKKVEKALSMVSLSGFDNRMPAQLSGGQQQRVAVARALVFDPSVVLMDEPLGALDKNLRESMQYEIKHIHESIGVTVVYVTHDQGEALTMSNRIAVFNDGKVQQLSSPDELYESPVNSFVAKFIGENNTFRGEVLDVSSDKCKIKLETGGEIIANPISVNSKGEKTTVSLRPERALINPNEKMDNNHKGKIEEVIYHGDHTRVRLNLLGNNEFILKVPNSSANLDIKLGNEINIGWNSEDARALDPK